MTYSRLLGSISLSFFVLFNINIWYKFFFHFFLILCHVNQNILLFDWTLYLCNPYYLLACSIFSCRLSKVLFISEMGRKLYINFTNIFQDISFILFKEYNKIYSSAANHNDPE